MLVEMTRTSPHRSSNEHDGGPEGGRNLARILVDVFCQIRMSNRADEGYDEMKWYVRAMDYS